MSGGAGLRWRPLPQAEAPTEPTGETANEQYPKSCNGDCKYRVDLQLTSTAAKWGVSCLAVIFALYLLTQSRRSVIIGNKLWRDTTMMYFAINKMNQQQAIVESGNRLSLLCA